MPKQANRTVQPTAKNREKTAQNHLQPAKNVSLKPKNRGKSDITVAAAQVATDKTKRAAAPTAPARQLSRSTIKFVAAMNYLVFFVGFCACRHEPFERYHHNQALWLWIVAAVLYLGFGFIPGVNIVALPFVIMLHVMGIITGVSTALHGRIFTIPLLGKIKIIDWEKV